MKDYIKKGNNLKKYTAEKKSEAEIKNQKCSWHNKWKLVFFI